MEPGERALDDPALRPQPAPVGGGAGRENGLDAARLQFVAVRVRVVRPVSVDSVWPASGVAGEPGDPWDRVNQRDDLRDVVAVRGRQRERERDAAPVGDQVMLAARTASIDWAWAAFFPPRPSLARARSQRRSSTSRSCPLLSASQAERGEAAPRHPTPASREDDAST